MVSNRPDRPSFPAVRGLVAIGFLLLTTAAFDCSGKEASFFGLDSPGLDGGDEPEFELMLDLRYRHLSGFSKICYSVQTEPAQPGATGSYDADGPGVESGYAQGEFELDSSGYASGAININSYGEYSVDATVTSNGTTATADSNINVTSSEGTGSC